MACTGLDREQRLAPEVETTIYRVVQEAFTNVARHAAATATQVNLVLHRDGTRDGTRDGSHLLATVEDDGPGFDPEAAGASGRLGLAGMRERAALVNGTLQIESSPGQGTTVFLRIPLPPVPPSLPPPGTDLSAASATQDSSNSGEDVSDDH